MKIKSIAEAIPFLNQVKEKREKFQDTLNRERENLERKESGSDSRNENGRGEPDEQEVEKAISTFGADEQAQASGITAESSGKGPGLKVVLKDSAGGVLRQMSAEEFLKLRESIGNPKGAAKTPGKILDQKL